MAIAVGLGHRKVCRLGGGGPARLIRLELMYQLVHWRGGGGGGHFEVVGELRRVFIVGETVAGKISRLKGQHFERHGEEREENGNEGRDESSRGPGGTARRSGL